MTGGAAGGRVRLTVVGVVLLAAVGLLAATSVGEDLVYYRTPSEVSAGAEGTGRVRLGGMVVPGSVTDDGPTVRFVLTDGAAEVAVEHQGDPGGVFQEGQGALVEGEFDGAVFRSDFLVVKHSNEYRAADGEPYSPPGGAAAPVGGAG